MGWLYAYEEAQALILLWPPDLYDASPDRPREPTQTELGLSGTSLRDA
jgi:hypothetical protein